VDACLYLVYREQGSRVANAIARRMVVPPHRDGGQAQYVERPVTEPTCDTLADVIAWMQGNLDRQVSVGDLASLAAMSPRTFARRFVQETGTTPQRWLTGQRILLAQHLLEETDETVDVIAKRAGFGSATVLRHHFRSWRSTTPNLYRRTFRQAAGPGVFARRDNGGGRLSQIGRSEMRATDILVDGYGRIQEVVHDVLDGLTEEELTYQVDDQANTIAWLVWHLTRIQDDHVAAAGQLEQVWPQGWEKEFGLPFSTTDTGYGHTTEEVAAVRGPAGLLAGYHDATYEQSIAFIESLTDADMNRIVDRNWTPAVTMSVRLVSVLSDDLQHAGQAAYIRGLLDR
jgi:AraC-like DNA-binding protein